jgi:hypothetical protein
MSKHRTTLALGGYRTVHEIGAKCHALRQCAGVLYNLIYRTKIGSQHG